MTETDPNRVHDQIISRYDYHYKKNLTTKTIKQTSNRNRVEPWMTNDILADIRRRDRLAKINGRRADYKRLRNDIVYVSFGKGIVICLIFYNFYNLSL